ncbi:MAG: hypothetical protein ACLRYE_03105 [Gemmiger formicilis]|uniref:hypothetical protein n=1 Tax=Gemmiger formicilis TaxID=745368 RepID=UPI0039A292AA
MAQLWVTHPGERVLFDAARPSYWAGNGTLPKVNQYKAFAGLIYDIAPEHPVDFTHLYLPSMEFDRCEVEGKWAFVQLGSAYAAVYCSNGIRMQDFGSNKRPRVHRRGPPLYLAGACRAGRRVCGV